MNSVPAELHSSSQAARWAPSNARFSLASMGIACGLLGLAAAHPFALTAVIVGLAGYALLGSKQAVQALSLMVLIKYLNPALCDFPPLSGILFWGMTYAACLSFLIRLKPANLLAAVPVAYFYLVVLTLSFWSSQPLISILKATSFCGVVACLLIGYQGMDQKDTEGLGRWFFSLAAALFVASLPTLPFADIAFHRNGKSFQGILNHPQAFGIFWPPFILWFAFDWLFQPSERSRNVETLFLAGMLAMVIASRARTGMAAILLGSCATLVLLFCSKNLRRRTVLKRGLAAALAMGICVVAAVAAIPSVQEGVKAYLYKGEDARSVKEAFHQSRGRIIGRQWKNFLKSPWTGNGFGVYAEGFFPSGVKTFAGIPISASVEKGVTPTAVLEEIGVIGTVALLVFLIFLTKPLLSPGCAPWVAMFMGCLAVNFGEAIFFSLGGNGLFYWLLMGWCRAAARMAGREPHWSTF
ncbi:O-antigen ligase like membrane protein [Desulfacinum hydrothermale DSM 13146]|uniref:O-antigen ligase like membrane protein n=1 Tax=Desulfacinum hydrothermale DSM 13146 TaxID=1121390 RepID=A0A1W1XS66_9BACT|nr:O-antigen ligase family protein [Desulfacinum hydrothermale]SMC26704.1 O-antigen ligase like membrane protein [Desulfacinum hydrothermale DSM 13146]